MGLRALPEPSYGMVKIMASPTSRRRDVHRQACHSSYMW